MPQHRPAFLPALLLCCAAAHAPAQDVPNEFAAWPRPGAASQRTGPVPRDEWQRLQRAPDSFAPPLPSPGNAAMEAAARAGRWDEALALLKSGQGRARSLDPSSANVLELAAARGEAEVVRELLLRGADPDRVSERGFTPLGAAAFNGQQALLRQLARAGADLQRWGATGQTPLHLASLAGQAAAAGQLLQLGAELEALNRQRESALDVAAANGRGDVMDRLLGAGANLTRAGRR
jgi:ankyrin repeat protein